MTSLGYLFHSGIKFLLCFISSLSFFLPSFIPFFFPSFFSSFLPSFVHFFLCPFLLSICPSVHLSVFHYEYLRMRQDEFLWNIKILNLFSLRNICNLWFIVAGCVLWLWWWQDIHLHFLQGYNHRYAARLLVLRENLYQAANFLHYFILLLRKQLLFQGY